VGIRAANIAYSQQNGSSALWLDVVAIEMSAWVSQSTSSTSHIICMGKLAGQHKKNGTAKKLQGNRRGYKKSKMRLGKKIPKKMYYRKWYI